jgi:hypothetical protein
MKLVKQNKAIVQFANRIAIFAMKIGIAPKYQFVLGVQGRKSGRIYSTPVYIIEEKINRFLVSPYGEVAWVINARAAGKITLEKNNVKSEYKIIELSATQSASILKKYLALAPITQPYFDARPDSPVEMFIAEASRHPVFELIK